MDLLSLFPPFWQEDAFFSMRIIPAVQAAVTDYLNDVEALLHSGAASTAQEPFIERWEEYYGTQKKDGETLRDRRSAVVSKMRAGGVCTPDKLKTIAASFYGGEVEILERDPDDSTFTVKFVGQEGTPVFLEDVTTAFAAVAPAHLNFDYAFKYLLICEVETMTIEVISGKTLDLFAGR